MKPLTADRLARAMKISDESAALWVPHVNSALSLCGCTTADHVAQWIAHVGHESAGLTRLVESLNYSPDGLVKTWPQRFPLDICGEDKKPIKSALAERIGRRGSGPADERAIAIHVYGDRLGNRPGTDDGWQFRGRGPIQVTGRANYRECGATIGVDLETSPELLEMRGTGAASTAWYWRKHKLTGYGYDVERVTRKINGGIHGLDDRIARFRRALSVLKSTSMADELGEILGK